MYVAVMNGQIVYVLTNRLHGKAAELHMFG